MLLCIYGVFDKLQFPKYFWSTQGRQVMLGLGLSSDTYRLLFAAQHIWAGLLSITTFRFTFLHSLQKLYPRFFPTFNPHPTSPMHASPPRCLKWSSRGFDYWVTCSWNYMSTKVATKGWNFSQKVLP